MNETNPTGNTPPATDTSPADNDSLSTVGSTGSAAGSMPDEDTSAKSAQSLADVVESNEEMQPEGESGPDAELSSDLGAEANDGGSSHPSSVVGLGSRRLESLHFAVRNPKVVGGVAVLLAVLLIGLIGPLLLGFGPRERNVGPQSAPPSAEHWFGTTKFGEDVFTQFAYGIRATFLVAVLAAALAALIGMTIGFVAGYRGGIVDEILMTITNIVLVLPVFVVLIVVTAYLGINNAPTQAVIIGLFQWPWVARAVRAQTFSLRTRDYVDLARLTGSSPMSIIRREIAPNMASYLVMTFILLFAGAVLFAAALDFLGLGPRQGMSLGLMLQLSNEWGAALLGWWWWFIPPGATITLITGAAYVTNVGLDEVFNPKLREQ